MRRAHELPAAIQWHEGMLLAPPHFQQFATRIEELAHYHYLSISPYHFGIRTLRIDETLLLAGVFRVLELEAVLPDGLVISHRQGEAELEISLESLAEQLSGSEILVRLAVPVRKLGAAQVKGDLARYVSVSGEAVVDENTGEGEVDIPRLAPRLSLLAANDPPQKYVTLPLAGVTYVNEAFKTTDYIPPALETPKGSPLFALCASVAERCREKALFLAGKVDSGAGLSGPVVLETRMQVASLAAGLPPLEALLATGKAHPFPLYLAMCGLAGRLAGLSAGLVPPAFDPYDHENLRLAFAALKDFAFRAIDEGIIEAYTPVTFDAEGGAFSLVLREEWLGARLAVGIKVRRGVHERDTAAWMEEAVIGSEPAMASLLDRRVLGAARKRVESEREIVPPRGVLLYVIEPDPQHVLPGERLVIQNTVDSADAAPAAVYFFAPGR